MTGAGNIVEVQATAEKVPFSEEQFLALLALARKGIGQAGRPAEARGDVRACTHRPIAGRLVIATHNPGKLARCASCWCPTASRRCRRANSACPSRRRPARHSRQCPHQGARPRRKRPGMPAFADDSGLVVDALDGAPGIHSARWAGPDKDFAAPWKRSKPCCASAAPKRAEQRKAHFVSALCVAWPDGHVEEFEATGRRHAGLAAARRPRLRLRSDVPAGRHDAYVRRDDARGEARPAAAWPGLSHRAARSSSWRRRVLRDDALTGRRPSASTCIGRSACRSAPIATSTAMCATPRSTRRAIVRAFAAEIAATAERVRAAHGLDHLLRRRHALADAARDRRRRSSTPSASTGRSRPTSR